MHMVLHVHAASGETKSFRYAWLQLPLVTPAIQKQTPHAPALPSYMPSPAGS